MALKTILKRAADRARKKALEAAKKKAKEAALRVANKQKAAAKSAKATKARITTSNATAKAKKVAALKKAAEAKRVQARKDALAANQKKHLTPAQREKAYRENKGKPTSKDIKATNKATISGPKASRTAKSTTPTRIKAKPSVKGKVKTRATQKSLPSQASGARATVRKKGPAVISKSKRNAQLEASRKKNLTLSSSKAAKNPTGPKAKPGVKGATTRKRVVSKTTRLTKAEAARKALTKKRDIGAKAAAAKTPRSASKTFAEAGGAVKFTPSNKAKSTGLRDATKDYQAGQRDGKISSKKGVTSGKSFKEGDKRLNPRQVPKGTLRTRAEAAQKAASKGYGKAKRSIKMKETVKKTRKDLSGTERKALIRSLEKNLTRQEQAAGKRARGKSIRKDMAKKMNQSPSQAYQDERQMVGSRSRRRSTETEQKRAERLSAHMDRIKASGGYKPLKKTPTGNFKSQHGLKGVSPKAKPNTTRSISGKGRFGQGNSYHQTC